LLFFGHALGLTFFILPQKAVEEFQIGVSDPEKVGEGINQYSLYTISVKVS